MFDPDVSVDEIHSRGASGVGLGYPCDKLQRGYGVRRTHNEMPPVWQDCVRQQANGTRSERGAERGNECAVVGRSREEPTGSGGLACHVKEANGTRHLHGDASFGRFEARKGHAVHGAADENERMAVTGSNERVPRVGVLISGRGSNLQALIDAVSGRGLKAALGLVISNKPDALGLTRARQAGIETTVISRRDYASRAGFDMALVEALRLQRIDLVCLAGFMRLLGPEFCHAFPNRVLNIHPSLLPAFPGVEAQRQALDHGVKVSGATVHFVTPELDAGPIVQQATVEVRDDDTVSSLSARILEVEHVIYPAAVQRILHDPWRLEGRRVSFAMPQTS